MFDVLDLPNLSLFKIYLTEFINKYYLNSFTKKDMYYGDKKELGLENPLNKMPNYAPSDIFEHLINTSSSALFLFTKSTKAKNRILQIFNNDVSLYMFFTNTTINDFMALIKDIPKLKDWRDSKNNNLGHYYAVIKHANTKTELSKLYGKIPEWFKEKNSKGFKLLKIFEENGCEKKYMVEIKKKILNDEIKNSDDTALKKMRSRKKIQRRM